MPIRFRCPYCNRLLGIARRKAGTEITCPQCSMPVLVPDEEPEADRSLDDLDRVLAQTKQSVAPTPSPAPVIPAPEPARPAVAVAPLPRVAAESLPMPAPAVKKTAPVPQARPQPARRSEDSLFEGDVDTLLGLKKPVHSLGDDGPQKAKPVSGMDAMSLDDGTGPIVLSRAKVAALLVGVVLLLGAAFAAGFFVAQSL